MSYKIERPVGVADELRRVVAEQLDPAIERLSMTAAGGEGRALAVHDARKRLKKSRAVLRLAHGSLRPQDRRRENAAYRDTSRLLSGSRDAQVRLDSVAWLAGQAQGTHRILDQLQATLTARVAEGDDDVQAMDATVAALRDARGRVGDWNFGAPDGFAVVADGLERSYRRARKAMRVAVADPTGETLHDWRKRVKDTWYHLRMLTPPWPALMKRAAGQASDLADLLGRDHDLAVLVAEVTPEAFDGHAARDVARRVGEARPRLQADAFTLGRRLYAEKPKAFVARIKAYWQDWSRNA